MSCFDLGCNGCDDCIDPQDAEEIPRDWWVVIEPNGGKCYGGRTLTEACAAARNLAATDPMSDQEIAFRLRMARLLAEFHGDEVLSEQQCARYMGINLVSWRKLERCFAFGTWLLEGEEAAEPDEDSESVLREAYALSRGVEPEGRESEGPRAKPEEPGHEVARPAEATRKPA